jgi:hypothetical protein
MEQYEKILDFVLSKVQNDIRLYTNIPQDEELPIILNDTIVSMASNHISLFGLINTDEEVADAEVKSVREGDTSVEYADSAQRLRASLRITPISSDFIRMLNSVRRLP